MLQPVNILTFDVEDWPQSTVDHTLPVTERARDNTLRVLELLAATETKATFFVLGLVAVKFPDLVKSIRAAGHEIALHGYDHRPVHAMTREEFRRDIRRSRSTIEDVTGERIIGYRAPDFSISVKALWALTVLAEEQFAYDSSIFPFAGPRYGVPHGFRAPYRVRCADNPNFIEFPLATLQLFGLRFPAAGGGYFRLFPYALSRAAIQRLNQAGVPATTYFHPYEMDTREIADCRHAIPLMLRLSQGIGRVRVEPNLRRLISEFRWGSISQHLPSGNVLTGDRLLEFSDPSFAEPRWLEAGKMT